MELESRRLRTDIPDPGQEQSRQQLSIRESRLEPPCDDFDAVAAGRLLDQSDERLDIGTEADDVGRDGLVRRR